MDQAMEKMCLRFFGHMRSAEAKICLRIRAVWSGLSVSANKIIGYYQVAYKSNKLLILQNAWMESKSPDETLRMRRMI